jgi:hypothetical protein
MTTPKVKIKIKTSKPVFVNHPGMSTPLTDCSPQPITNNRKLTYKARHNGESFYPPGWRGVTEKGK